MTVRITRRTALRALGATLALPLLDAMGSPLAQVAEAASPPPVRTAFVFVPNGVVPETWSVQAAARAGLELQGTLEPLRPLASELLVLSQLTLDNARAKGDGPGDHARSAAAFLTTAHPFKTEGRDIKLGVSVDQLLAQALGARTRLPSLELGCEAGRPAGRCDSGYSCAYVSNIAWSSESTPVPKEVRPRLVFERLFGDPLDAEASARRRWARRSVLDLVADEAKRLRKDLGRADKQKLDEFEASVREVERRIERVETDGRGAAPPPDLRPPGSPRDYADHLDLMYELLALAFQMDLTRVATFMTGNEGSDRAYDTLGITDGHHALSHHDGDAAKIYKVKRIDRFHMERFAAFLKRLASVREGNRSLLDSCMVLYGSGIRDGNRHDHGDLPLVLAGRGGGTLAPGRHLVYPAETPLANLYLAMLQRAGVKADRFGDSTGPLGQLA